MKNIFITLLYASVVLSHTHAEKKPNDIDAAEVRESYWDKAKRLYDEKVRDSEIPSQVKEAAQKDFEKIGDWSYLVIAIEDKDPAKLTDFLNDAGDDRWECFFIQPNESSTLFYFKRREVSYIEKISKADLLKIFNTLSGE